MHMTKFPKSLGYTEETKPKTHGAGGRVELKVNGLDKFFIEITAKNFLSLEKRTDIQTQETFRSPKRQGQIREELLCDI